MLVITTCISLLAGLVAAIPAPVNNGGQNFRTFRGISTCPSNSIIDRRPIVAFNRHFYVNRYPDTSAYCPSDINGLDCSQYTIATVFLANAASVTLNLDVAIPGSQQVYIEESGALGYTSPGSTETPTGSMFAPFEVTPRGNDKSIGYLTFKSRDWLACPLGGDIYQIFAAGMPGSVGRGCLDIYFQTSSWGGNGAYEYQAFSS